MRTLPRAIRYVLRQFELLLSERRPVPLVTRLRLDARLYDPAPARTPGQTVMALWHHCGKPLVAIRWVLISDPDGKFESQALLSTDTSHPLYIMGWWRSRHPIIYKESRGAAPTPERPRRCHSA